MKRILSLCLLILLGASGCSQSNTDAEDQAPLTIMAASSMQLPLEALAEKWQEKGHQPPTLSFAASSSLARQIIEGADADIFISADRQWMDELVNKGRIKDEFRKDIAGNYLALVAPIDARMSFLHQEGVRELIRICQIDKQDKPDELTCPEGPLAIADPDHVPAGRYAKQAMEKWDQWDKLSPKLVRTQNVREALRLVEQREAGMAIVYSSDVRASIGATPLSIFPADSHQPIIYPAAAIGDSPRKQARDFLEWLTSEEACGILKAKYMACPFDHLMSGATELKEPADLAEPAG